MTSREERMAQRMRGAQSHQVEDVSFGPLFPVLEEAPPPMAPPPVPSIPRPTPNASNISVKRSRLATDPSPPGPPQPIVRRRSPRNRRPSQENDGKDDPYTMPDTSNESIESAKSVGSNGRTPVTGSLEAKRNATDDISPILSPSLLPTLEVEDEPEDLRRHTPQRLLNSPDEEVTESPADAPGSGHRRRIATVLSSVAQSTSRLQELVANEDELANGMDSFASSSPSVRKTRRSTASASRNSGIGRTPLSMRADAEDELSPDHPNEPLGFNMDIVEEETEDEDPELDHDETTALLKVGQDVLHRGMMGTSPVLDSVHFDLPDISGLQPLMEEGEEEAQGEAEEITDLEATKLLGKRKLRASLPSAPAEAPELVSPPKRRGRRKRQEVEGEIHEESVESPSDAQPKRRGRKKRNVQVLEPEPEPEPEESEPEPEVVKKALQKGRKRKKQQHLEPEADERGAESETPVEQPLPNPRRAKRNSKEAEVGSLPQVESVAEDSHPLVERRHRKRKAAEPEPEPETEPEPEEPREEEQPKKKPRKSKDQAAPPKTRKSVDTQNKSRPLKQSRSKTCYPIAVQRFTQNPWPVHDSDDDILHSEIPFAKRTGVNILDVLAQVCEELLREALAEANNDNNNDMNGKQEKRELRVKYRALEGYREELKTRLLEQAITVDNLYTVQKRVKAVQKEKIGLRDEILRIRQERDEVALRMDIVRMRHEVDSKSALHQIGLSTNMHNIDLAVEAGHAAQDLAPAEKKAADLGNLEFMIAKAVDEASGKSRAGGALRQIKEFNAFLERAAITLEGR